MLSLLQIATFGDFAGWLFGVIFSALMGLFWFWIRHSVAEMSDNIKELNGRINKLERNQVRMEEQLSSLRKEVSQYIAGQRKFFYEMKQDFEESHGQHELDD